MESIFDGAFLFKQFMNHKKRKCNIFFKCKKEPKKMWNIVLGCFKHALQYSKSKQTMGHGYNQKYYHRVCDFAQFNHRR